MDKAHGNITASPTEAPRPDAERMDHARTILADRYGDNLAAWLATRWCRMLVLVGTDDGGGGVIAELRRHVQAVGDADDLAALAQVEEAAVASADRRRIEPVPATEPLPTVWDCTEARSGHGVSILALTAELAALDYARRCWPTIPDPEAGEQKVMNVFVRLPETGEVSMHRMVRNYVPTILLAPPGSAEDAAFGPRPELDDGDLDVLESAVYQEE